MTEEAQQTPTPELTAEQQAVLAQMAPPVPAPDAPPVDNDHVEPGATQFTPEEIAANADAKPPEHQLSYLETIGMALEDMQIAMLSATEVTFKNGRSLPILGFTDENGEPVTNLANAKCAHAGDGSISIPLVGVPVAR